LGRGGALGDQVAQFSVNHLTFFCPNEAQWVVLNTFFSPITKEIVSQVGPIGCQVTQFSPHHQLFWFSKWSPMGALRDKFPPFLNRKVHHPCMGPKKET